jgi:ABC-2 type transport system permease protein
VTTALRIFFVGGLTSYRALFNWLSPWIFVPTFLIAPIFQILLFVYIGRSAHVQSDEFYVIGNALQYAAIPCIFAMSGTITDERYQQTLGFILVSPAGRLPLFLGRSLPVIANAIGVSAFALAVGGAIVGIHVPASAIGSLALVIAVSAASCTGLGLVGAAIGLRVRETATLNNIVFGVLLVFCGVNVALDELPGWMSFISQGLPLTHGIEAARRLAGGQSLGTVGGLVGAEVAVGATYTVLGYLLLRYMEWQSRRLATLETA